MTSTAPKDELAALLFDYERRIKALEAVSQLGTSTIGDDTDTAVDVEAVVSEAVVSNAAIPAIQDAIAGSNQGLLDLQAAIASNEALLDARFQDAAQDLTDSSASLEASQANIEAAFGQRVDGLSDDVDTAITAAGGAASTAIAAKAAADQAAKAATDANSLAATAKTAADDANSAALAASGLAAAKGKVIVQVSAPTGANADPANLWIDITADANGNPKNTPNRYNASTSKWEPITDQKVVDAAAAAAAASNLAASASSAASAADTKAQNAQTAANSAQATANNAGQAAAAAQTTADTAKTNASTAQIAADAAKAAAAVAAAKAVATAAGVLDNGSAEFDFDSWDATAKGSIVVQASVVRSGSKAWQGTTNGEIRQGMFPVKLGDTWRFRWWHWTTNSGTGTPNGGLRLQKSTDNGATWSDAGSANPSVTTAFTSQDVTYTVPATVTHLRARVAFANPSGVVVSFDDLELVNITDAKAAADAASTAQTAAGAAQSTADTAKTNAATAQSTADAAKTAAAAAQSTADAAKANAATAQTAADNANSQALSAAGIANGKGKVIYQASAPTGANAVATNLWIRTTDNTPWTYDGSKWVQVTDKTATDAASAAATAQQAATAASNAAAAAQATADAKPQILFSSTAGPSGTAPTGTIWFLWDSSKNVAGQWLQSGTLAAPVWTPQQIRSEVIANLDVAKLTAGSAAIAELVAQKIAASTANFQTANVSNLFVTQGATLSQAVIDFLFANVVQAKKITAGMIDVATLNGITLTGVTVTGGTLRTAPTTDAYQGSILLDKDDIYFQNTTGTAGQINSGYINLEPSTGSLSLLTLPYGTTPNFYVLVGDKTKNVDLYARTALFNSVKATDFQTADGKSIVRPNIVAGSGTYSGGNIAGNRGNVTVTVNFPSGSFSSAPVVVPVSGNSRILPTIASVSATQVQILLLNYTDTTITSSVNYSWVAIGS